ncbi:hypothetical protein STAS_33426 [Striga asiatica]|uniref:Uncharacterized protein n=1 Tax=Striga asiatica TaxID=4170 RepID=A0A5A7RDP3_STRAF|nr:hypothetical protein STAS_33426 [Striga asiatica]
MQFSSINPDFHQKPLSLHNKLLSKETSKSNPSFRIYYGELPSSVPFTWETIPGTPKHHHASAGDHHIPPPLTPPPSYHAHSNSLRASSENPSRPKILFQNLLRHINPKKPSLGSSSSSSSSSSFSDHFRRRKRRRFSGSGSSFDSGCSVFVVKKALLSIVGRGSG